MRWFKHDADANSDAKLKRVRIKYGLEGYGLYWYCLELIAGDVSKDKITFELEHDAEIIAHDTGIHYQRVQDMMSFMVNLGLFQQVDGVIRCIKMAQRLDQSMTSNPEMRRIIESFKAGSHDSVMLESPNSHDCIMTGSAEPMQDKIRLDKNKDTTESDDSRVVFDYWFSVMNKTSRTLFTADRKSKIKARLRDGYTVDDIKRAIDGCKSSEYHQGKNDSNKVYDDIELICRNGSSLEKFWVCKKQEGAFSGYMR